MKRFISYLLYNKQSLNKIQEEYLRCQYDVLFDMLMNFFDYFFKALPSLPGDVSRYVIGYEAVQNAIAKYLHTRIILLEGTRITWKRTWDDEVVTILEAVDWSIKNPDWARLMVVTKTTKGDISTHFPHPAIRGLVDYLEMKAGNRLI